MTAQLAPWLPVAVRLAAADVYDDESRGEALDLLTALVHAPYVVIVEDDAPRLVQPFPDPRVFYGGLYEATGAGAACGTSIIRLCKSTAEPFRAAERRSVIAGMRDALFADAAADDEADEWTFAALPDEDPRIVSAPGGARVVSAPAAPPPGAAPPPPCYPTTRTVDPRGDFVTTS